MPNSNPKGVIVDWKRNNKVALRNFSTACDFHDLIKTLLVRMLRRNYKCSKRYPLYTENNPLEPNENYPDIWCRIKGDVYVWEIQDKITAEWTEKITEKYDNVTLIIVPLKEIMDDWCMRLIRLENPVESLKKILEDYVI